MNSLNCRDFLRLRFLSFRVVSFFSCLLPLYVLFSSITPAAVLAESPPARIVRPTLCELRKAPELSSCAFYRSKKARLGVYEKPASDSTLLGYVERGDYVCYVGELQEFAIILWNKQERLKNSGAEIKGENTQGYVRLADLWPDSTTKSSLLAEYSSRLKQPSMVQTEDPIWPLSLLVNHVKSFFGGDTGDCAP